MTTGMYRIVTDMDQIRDNLRINSAINIARVLTALEELLARTAPNEQQIIRERIERIQQAQRHRLLR